MGRSKKVLLLLLPLATKQWNLSRATKLGYSFTSFLFLLFKRTNLDHWWFSLFEREFSIQILRTFIPTTFLSRKRMISLSR
jgi:hypothetical protein